MTYAQAITQRDALEAAMLASAGMQSVTIGDRSITYTNATKQLAELNRSIQTYTRKSKNQNPYWRSPIWR